MAVTINLGKIFFIHCLLAVQDVFNASTPNGHTNTNEFLQNLDIFIGNNSEYTMNTRCAGGPFMIVGDYASSYS